jgi:L-2-hydroxycarboxylate dehydrogenase (NAD+)
MGHLVMSRAADMAIRLAEEAGVGWVGVRGSNHAGPAALYAIVPLARDMIGIYTAVASANHMPPWGGPRAFWAPTPSRSLCQRAMSRHSFSIWLPR